MINLRGEAVIKDLAVSFEKAKRQFPDIVQDNYRLKEGLYLRINPEESWQTQIAALEQNHLVIWAKEEEYSKLDLLQWFKQRDYWSSTLNSNKSVDNKKQVHSNNPFSLFVKQDVFLEEKKDAKFNMSQNIERYLEATESEQVKQKWNDLIPGKKKGEDPLSFFQNSVYASALEYLDSPARLQWITQITQWYDNNVQSLTDFIRTLTFKNYVKLFFTLDGFPASESPSCEQMYAYEYDLYLIPKIYNSNDYNQIVADELTGLPSYDMTMNSKKPFLEHKTMRVEAPDRVPLKQALLAKEATEWLAATKPKYSTNKLGYETGFVPGTKRTQPEGTFHVYMDGKYDELHSFENVPFPAAVSVDVEWLNILQVHEKSKDNPKDEEWYLKFYQPIQSVETLQKTISSRFFRGRMNGQILFDEPGVKTKEFTGVMAALFLQSRQAFHDWFSKGTTLSLHGIFAQVTLRLIEEQLLYVESSRLSDLADAMNLRLSIIKMLGEKGGTSMADRIQHTHSSLSGKLAANGVVGCANDEEFYFLAGQLARYLTNQSETQKKTGNMFESFLRARNGKQLKKRLDEAYMLYKHKIQLQNRKFNAAFSMVMGYITEQVNEGDARELLLAGLFANNLMYEKKDEGADSDGEEN